MSSSVTPSAAAGPSNPPSSTTSSTEAIAFKTLHPEAYLREWLDAGFRPEKKPGMRKAEGEDAWRDVSINLGAISTATSSVLVRIGNTTLLASLKPELSTPTHSSPNTGWIAPNLDLPAICSPLFKTGPPGDEAQVISRQLADLLASTNPIPLTSLCVHPGKSAWVLYIDLVCINYDGNIWDAAVLGMMICLRKATIPKATYNPDTTPTTLCSRTEVRELGKEMRCFPLSASFGVFQDSYLLPDPPSFESPMLPTSISIAYDILPLLMASSSTVKMSQSASKQKLKLKLVRQNGLGGMKGLSGLDLLGRAMSEGERRCRALVDVLIGAGVV